MTYHVDALTGNPRICRNFSECSDSLTPVGHHPDKASAKAAWDTFMTNECRRLSKSSARLSEAYRANQGIVPDWVVEVVSGYVEWSPFEVSAVTPSGSQLYNSMLSEHVHDYDFVLFCQPHELLSGYRHVMIGLVDLFLVPIDKLIDYASMSQIPESFFGVIRGNGWWNDSDKVWTDESFHEALAAAYFEKLREHIEKFESGEYDEARRKRGFKHHARWKSYVKRIDINGEDSLTNFSPTLSEAERKDFLKLYSELSETFVK